MALIHRCSPLLFALTALVPRGALAEGDAAAETVALEEVRGPNAGAPLRVFQGLRAGLEEAGLRVVYGTALEKAARKAGARNRDLARAAAAGAGFSVIGEVKAEKGGFVAEARCLAVPSGDERAAARERYASAKEAKAAGKALAAALLDGMDEPSEPAPRVVVPSAPARIDSEAARPVESAPVEAREVPPPAPAASVEITAEDAPAGPAGPEESLLRIGLAVGTQAASAYTVTVGAQATGLAYELSPLFRVGVGAELSIPGTGLGLELSLGLAPVAFSIDVEPQVSPADPGGVFLDGALALSYALTLSRFGAAREGALVLRPLLGAGYAQLSVEGQGDNTVVVGYRALDLAGGLALDARLSRRLALELEGRFGYVVAFSETPASTGEAGGGLALRVGGRARYWLNDGVGVFVGAQYRFQRIGLSGEGTRVTFVDDPPLVGATVFTSDLQLVGGAAFAF